MSAKMPWFRMYTDFLNDPKMIALAFEDQRHFIGILALKSDGAIDDSADENLLNRIVAQRLWIDHGVIRDVKKRLYEAGLIDTSWQPIAWDKRQFVSDRDSTAAERKRRERAAKSANVTDMSRVTRCDIPGHVTRLEADTDTDTETEADTEKEGEKKSAYAPPLPPELLKDFLQVRKAKKAGALTKTAMAGIQREADKAGISLDAAVTACCEFGWQGFNAQWYADRTAGKPVAAMTGNRYPDKNAIPPVSTIWHESAAGVAQKAAELGLPAQGDVESHPVFKARVLAAAGFITPTLSELAAQAAKRGYV